MTQLCFKLGTATVFQKCLFLNFDKRKYLIKDTDKKPILVILKSLRLRDEIFKKKQDLKKFPQLKKIWIGEDANPTIRKQKNESRSVVKLAIAKGYQAQQRGTGVIVDGRYYPTVNLTTCQTMLIWPKHARVPLTRQ